MRVHIRLDDRTSNKTAIKMFIANKFCYPKLLIIHKAAFFTKAESSGMTLTKGTE